MKKRIAVIDRSLYKDFKLGQVLMNVCPVNRAGEDCITLDENKFPVIDENLCIGCGLCVKAAERAGCHAITIVNLPKELEETPIHRFGVNEFVLYRLPYPVVGQIVGLVGPNGIGKTTTLKILSGELKPNLGDWGKEAKTSELKSLFRGTELQDYFEKIEGKQIKTVVKPQRVDQIPSAYKGKISKLLEHADERKILNDLLKVLNIEPVLDSKVEEVSGGELQKVAIAACLSKDADIYYFDEPTSFLDVQQRLTVAKAIREFCKNKSVMVVDHDLAVLDFLADRVHIFYGVSGVYGIISKPYGVRVGINTFLDGFIKEDNVRIRDYPITFFSSIIERGVSPKVLVSFKNVKKKFERFELDIKSGDIRKQEVLAVLGANALGKTTFAKILSGELKQDKGEITAGVKISYKPQYIQTEFRGSVKELLSTTGDVSSETYKSEIIRPLGLEKLMEKDVQELSGGELQRVAIALTLSRPVDLYVLDEPSAFLDVEQRLAVAKLINKIIEIKEASALVIDHDLLFLSQVGSRAMVFLGESSRKGHVEEVDSVKNGFNTFLSTVGVTFRAEPATGRPRANKLNSQLDTQQKEDGEYWQT